MPCDSRIYIHGFDNRERLFLVFLVLSGVGGLLEEELVEGDATLEGKQSLVSTPRISSHVPFFDLHALIFKR